MSLTYNGNEYSKFYSYKNPKMTHATRIEGADVEEDQGDDDGESDALSIESNYQYCFD